MPTITDGHLRRLEAAFDDWFESKHRGRGCRVLQFPDGSKTRLVVRHGQRMAREANHGDDGAAGIAYYRPQKHDVLVYDSEEDVIAVHAGTKGEIRLFIDGVGRIIFGKADYFPHNRRFTLKPLVEDGPRALLCEDIEGLERVRLVEVRRYWGGVHKELEIRKANDVFAALHERGRLLNTGGRLEAAVFKVTFSDSPKERSVTIRPTSNAIYERDSDSELIEEWLDRRGFITREHPTGTANEVANPSLAVA